MAPNRQPWDVKLEQLELVLAESTAGFQKIGKLITDIYGATRATMDEVEDIRGRLSTAEARVAALEAQLVVMRGN